MPAPSGQTHLVSGRIVGAGANEPEWTQDELQYFATLRATRLDVVVANDSRKAIPDRDGKYVVKNADGTCSATMNAILPDLPLSEFNLGVGVDSCSSCYKPTCPGAESCATLYAISDLVVTYAQVSPSRLCLQWSTIHILTNDDIQQSEPTSTPTLNSAPTSAPTQQMPTKQASIDESDTEDEENWQDKLVIKATECIFNDIQLSAPPFPFRQRWDMDAREVISERKNRGTKRKRREYEEYEDEDYEYYNHEDIRRIYDGLMAAALANVAVADTGVAGPVKRRKKAMRKRKQGGAAAGEGVAGPAGGSA
ncbi:uncharacterized protein CDV56_108763 [Aspergillus thermomutatus]|uniref:Uncharacterized protein n=1 Tax=Aspergillus thermomutatus TaxID=41047 RepID=A0A397HE09_ASPTH|nr:uncharacterized protein CDV56_108763 [Aspergillus thermomutatus]RHZ59826.1 hypothetical protein CDV56_108763 [Aspergillus thermomutatus]